MVWRRGKEIALQVQPGELQEGAESSSSPGAAPGLGLSLQTLTPEIAQRLGLSAATRGALVGAVRPGSAAAEAGIRERDVIVEIDRKPVATAEEAAKRLAETSPTGHLVLLLREGTPMFLALPSRAG